MKKCYAGIFIIFLTLPLFAQMPACNEPPSLNEQFKEMLQHLDKEQIPSGILYENVFPWAEMESYDGTTDTDTSSYQHFMQAYHELYQSSFNTSGMTHPTDLEEAIGNFHPDKEYHHPFGIIDYQYNTIDPNAVANNLLSISNGQLYDVPGRVSSPYITKTVSLGSMLLGNSDEQLLPGTHYLHFSPNFVLTNTGFSLNDVQNLKIYINDSLAIDTTISGLSGKIIPLILTFITAPVVITAVITTLSYYGQYKFFKGIFGMKETFPLTACGGQDELVVTGASYDGGYGKPAYAAKGKANIFYADSNCGAKRLTKPIIFVDGFDPTNAQHGAQLWHKYINVEIDFGNGDVLLGDSLRRAGYDIITFDQADEGTNRGGGGFMENNALALVKLLDTLYSLHQNTLQQDFILVGASMGGLVSRYALTYMEYHNMPHHTRLFVSFDSPQLGAQIPVGVQQFVDLIGVYGGLKGTDAVQGKAVHLSDAARQLLVHHSSTQSETIESDPFRTRFQNNLNALGSWPVLCRKIAVVDGNRIGTLKSVTPQPTPPGFEPMYSCGYELDFGIKRRLFKNCTSPGCYKLHSQSFTQTSDTRCKSMDFVVKNNTNLLKMLFTGGDFTTQSFFTQSENGTSYDIAPGARFGVDPLGSINGWVRAFAFIVTGHLKIDENLIPHTNFIPTVSSVAYTFPNNEPFSIYKDFTGVNLSRCAGTTPFDTVYAPLTDLNHVQIDRKIAESFLEEILHPKSISVCAGNCPEYLTLSSPLSNGTVQDFKASKAINLEPNFSAPDGTVIKADIGCPQGQGVFDYKMSKRELGTSSILPICDFEWESTTKTCLTNSTIFGLKTNKFIDINTYVEFSMDSTTWEKANFSNLEFNIKLNGNSNQTQSFYARPKNDQSNVIKQQVSFCNVPSIQWNNSLNEVNCFQFYTNFKVFVSGLSNSTYAEFSINGGNWLRANINDDGYSLNINANPGQPQIFYARPHNDPANTIQISLNHCP